MVEPVTKRINLTPKKIALFLGATVLCLLLANLLIVYLRFVQDYKHLRGFVHGFYFDHEANFPSLYSFLAILFCSISLWKIGSMPKEKTKRHSLQWKFLAVVFLFLAIDEFGSVHEHLIQPMNSLVARSSIQSDYLYFAWFIPYTIVTLVIAVFYLRFFLKLPSGTRILFALAAVIFMCGAVAMEMVGGKYWAQQGWSVDGADEVDLTYALIVTVEELLEMIGIVVFVYALCDYYFKRRRETFTIQISDGHQKPSSTTRSIQDNVQMF